MVNVVLVDTPALLEECIADVSSGRSLAVDLEGVDLCRHGTLCLLQVLREGGKDIWVVDVTVLGQAAFEPVVSGGQSLKGVLEDESIVKMFYDCRNDVDALWNLHRVFPMNIWDLQLQELCYGRVRSKQKRLLNGLAKALTEHLGNMSADWKSHKYQGRKLFAPELGGSYKVFEARPLDPRVLAYSAADVELLFALRDALHRVQRAPWQGCIEAEGAKRALAAKGAFAGNGRHMALVPTLW